MKFLFPIAVVLLAAGLSSCSPPPSPPLGPGLAVAPVRSLPQNWPQEIRKIFYQQPIGSEILPYDWFLALEQPQWQWNPFHAVGRFAQPEYLARFGFLPAEPEHATANPLPVGLVKDTRFTNPFTGEIHTALGLTCAACHTGQWDIQTAPNQWVGLRIDGGAGHIDLTGFENALLEALKATANIPLRFDRFAHAVLGENYSSPRKALLKQQFTHYLEQQNQRQSLFAAYSKTHPSAGFGRLDTLNRIANHLMKAPFGQVDAQLPNAPVNFPPIWEASWFDYGRYNGSSQNPLLRNLVKALWAKTPVVLAGEATDRFKSAAQLDSLYMMETLLSGEAPYQGLRAPAWPVDVLGAVDAQKSARGARLYAELCASCHQQNKAVLQADADADAPVYWTSLNHLGQPLLRIANVPLDEIGTDPAQAQGFASKQLNAKATFAPGVEAPMSLFNALDYITQQVAERYFAENAISAQRQVQWGNGHKVAPSDQQLTPSYHALPLSGIWATPPYLHNGSVPSLYALLSPLAERPVSFVLGGRSYDAKTLGLASDTPPTGYVLDTRTQGNSNSGHEFNHGQGTGIIGRKLSVDERWDLIEYLKTL